MSVNWDSSATVMMLEQLETPDSYVPGGPTGSTTLAGAVRYVTTLKAEDRLRAAIVVAEHAGTSKTLLEVADIEGLDLGRTFAVVLLSSNLVNTPYADQRAAFLETCAHHVAPGGCVLVQRLDPELVPDAIDAESTADGVTYSLKDVEHVGDLFVATVGFTIGDRHWDHRFRGEVLDDDAFQGALGKAGLTVTEYLDGQRTWAKAVLA